jgi:hypothetical protein
MVLSVNRDYSLNSIKQLIFVMVKCVVLFVVWTDFLNTLMSFSFRGLNNFHL